MSSEYEHPFSLETVIAHLGSDSVARIKEVMTMDGREIGGTDKNILRVMVTEPHGDKVRCFRANEKGQLVLCEEPQNTGHVHI